MSTINKIKTKDNIVYDIEDAAAVKSVKIGETEYKNGTNVVLPEYPTAGSPAVDTIAWRNVYAGTADMTAGSSALPTGTIYVVYE